MDPNDHTERDQRRRFAAIEIARQERRNLRDQIAFTPSSGGKRAQLKRLMPKKGI